MTKLFIFCFLMSNVIFAANAQTTNKLLERNPADRSEFSKIKSNLYKLSKDVPVIDFGVGEIFMYEPSMGNALNNFEPYSLNQFRFPVSIWQDNKVFLKENISKLPAVNTIDIIRILDADRILTNW